MFQHTFEDINILYGNATYNVSGTAEYELEDIGIGSYEYWGAKGNDSYMTVNFIDAELDDITLFNPIEWEHQTLTEQDKNKIKDLLIEQLNDDRDLCDEIAWEHFDEPNE